MVREQLLEIFPLKLPGRYKLLVAHALGTQPLVLLGKKFDAGQKFLNNVSDAALSGRHRRRSHAYELVLLQIIRLKLFVLVVQRAEIRLDFCDRAVGTVRRGRAHLEAAGAIAERGKGHCGSKMVSQLVKRW